MSHGQRLRRATLVVLVDQVDEVEIGEAWFARWRMRLTYCSDNTGCGCCVDIWDVEGPAEAIAELPERMQSWSAWAHPD